MTRTCIYFQTLALLFNMTNSVNVQPVCDKLLQHMINSSDPFHKEDLLHKIIELTQKYPLYKTEDLLL